MRVIALAMHAALLAGIIVRGWPGFSQLWALPLLAAAPGLWRGRVYTFQWLSLLILFYIGGYVAAGYSEPLQRTGLFGMASFAALEFAAVVLFVRFRARECPAVGAA